MTDPSITRFRDIRRNPSRLILAEQLGRRAARRHTRLIISFAGRAYAGGTEDAVCILGKWPPRRQGMENCTTGKPACQIGRRP